MDFLPCGGICAGHVKDPLDSGSRRGNREQFNPSPLNKKGHWVSQGVLLVKNPPANAGDVRNAGWTPGLGRFPRKRAWQPTPVFLPGDSHGQRSLTGYSPWGHKELDMTEAI